MVLGDPTAFKGNASGIAGKLDFTVLTTFDGGALWSRQQYREGQLKVEKGTNAFAASNSALTLVDHIAWFGSGGRPGAFVFVGDSYSEIPDGICNCVPMPPKNIWFTHRKIVPLTGGTDSAGVFSLAFRDKLHGAAVGGDYTKPNDSAGTAAWTADGGEHWTAAERPPHGYRSAVAWDSDAKAWIAVGTNGSDISYDDGKTWTLLDNGSWNALSFPWVVGPQGRIAKLDPGNLPHK
jgi:photosystem II stability/assembly factor-like uncharacterized protein